MSLHLIKSHVPLFHLKSGTNSETEKSEQKRHASKHWARTHDHGTEPHIHVSARPHFDSAPLSANDLILKQEEATVEWIERYTTEVHRGRIHVKTVFVHLRSKSSDPNSAFAIFADAL